MNMNDTFKELFGSIQAEERLKEQTKAFLLKRTNGYTGTRPEKRIYRFCAATCICFLFTLIGGYWIYFTPTAQISIDINPSIEMNINRFDQVISVNDFNEDGRELSETLNVKYKSYTDAIEQILSQDTVVTLLSGNEIMTITVIGSDGSQSAKMLSEINEYTAGQSNTYCYFASPEDVAPAHEMGLSCGKYRAFLELQFYDPTITPEIVQGMTMREIRDLINSHSSDSENDAPSTDNRGNGYGHGNGYGKRWRKGETGQQETKK